VQALTAVAVIFHLIGIDRDLVRKQDDDVGSQFEDAYTS
jgi:hypothetical protein